MAYSTAPAADDRPHDQMRAIAERRDRAAFASIFALYAPKLKAFLMRGGLEDGVAEELVQEVMLTVWRRADTFDPAQGELAAWLFTIARNRRIDYFRRLQAPPGEAALPFLLPEPPVPADGLVEAMESHTSLRIALEKLPSEQATVLQKAFFEHKSHSAIATEQGLPLGTVKSRIRLALRQLRRSLGQHRL